MGDSDVGGPDLGGPDRTGPDRAVGVATARTGTVGAVAWSGVGDAGSTSTPVLLLHGLTDSGECWDPVMRHLADDRFVVAVDARGHGHTPLGDAPFTIEALARDALDVLREVVGRPALVVGHSMGGLVAEELALTAPDLVAGLLLEDPAWVIDADTSATGAPTFLAAMLASFAGADADQLARWSRRECPSWPDDEHETWARSKVQVDQHLAEVEHDWGGRSWVSALAGVLCPVTLVTGAPERGGLVDDASRTRAGALLGDRLIDVPIAGAGHNVRRDDRAAFLAALDRALARV